SGRRCKTDGWPDLLEDDPCWTRRKRPHVHTLLRSWRLRWDRRTDSGLRYEAAELRGCSLGLRHSWRGRQHGHLLVRDTIDSNRSFHGLHVPGIAATLGNAEATGILRTSKHKPDLIAFWG